jgi:hypothetical protein
VQALTCRNVAVRSKSPCYKAGHSVSDLDDVAMVGQAVEQRGGHLGVAEYACPLSECEIEFWREAEREIMHETEDLIAIAQRPEPMSFPLQLRSWSFS